MTDDDRIRAQLAHTGRPMSAAELAEALGLAEARDALDPLARLTRAKHVAVLRVLGSGVPLYETTPTGAAEATGGAQLRFDGAPDRPPVPIQGAIF